MSSLGIAETCVTVCSMSHKAAALTGRLHIKAEKDHECPTWTKSDSHFSHVILEN